MTSVTLSISLFLLESDRAHRTGGEADVTKSSYQVLGRTLALKIVLDLAVSASGLLTLLLSSKQGVLFQDSSGGYGNVCKLQL